MNWFRRLLDKAQDPDKYWREYHRQRREKRLQFYRQERTRLLDRVAGTERMIAYYADKIRVLDGDHGG